MKKIVFIQVSTLTLKQHDVSSNSGTRILKSFGWSDEQLGINEPPDLEEKIKWKEPRDNIIELAVRQITGDSQLVVCARNNNQNGFELPRKISSKVTVRYVYATLRTQNEVSKDKYTLKFKDLFYLTKEDMSQHHLVNI